MRTDVLRNVIGTRDAPRACDECSTAPSFRGAMSPAARQSRGTDVRPLRHRRFRDRPGDLSSRGRSHTCIGQDPHRELVVFGIQVRRRHPKDLCESLCRLDIWHVLPRLILIDPWAGNRRIEARFDAQLLLRDTEPLASLPQAIPNDRNASHLRPTCNP